MARRHVLDDAVSGISRNIGLLEQGAGRGGGLVGNGPMSGSGSDAWPGPADQRPAAGLPERLSRFRQDAVAELSRLQTELAQLMTSWWSGTTS